MQLNNELSISIIITNWRFIVGQHIGQYFTCIWQRLELSLTCSLTLQITGFKTLQVLPHHCNINFSQFFFCHQKNWLCRITTWIPCEWVSEWREVRSACTLFGPSDWLLIILLCRAETQALVYLCFVRAGGRARVTGYTCVREAAYSSHVTLKLK